MVIVSPGLSASIFIPSRYEADPKEVPVVEAVALTPADCKAALMRLTAPVPPPATVSCIAYPLGVPPVPPVRLILPEPLKITFVLVVPSLIEISTGGDASGIIAP
jgi:hypothetical protein